MDLIINGQTLGEPVHMDELATLIPGDTDAARVRLLRVSVFHLRQKIEPAPKNPTYLRTVRDFGYYLSQKPEGLGE
jgi:two-component system alkaline phosphatase synthesis response regulator PhoP